MIKLSDHPEAPIQNLDIPLLCDGACFKVNKAALERKAKRLLKEGNFHFNVKFEGVHYPLPAGVVQPTAIVYGVPFRVSRHVDGLMDGSILTLLSGVKQWTVHSPDGKKVYSILHKKDQTVYIPPGFSHEVFTTSNKSIAYGAFWESTQKEKVEALCENRTWMRTKMLQDHRDKIAEQFLNLTTITSRKGRGSFNKLLNGAGRLRAISKTSGSTRRDRGGRIRKGGSKKLVLKKRHRK